MRKVDLVVLLFVVFVGWILLSEDKSIDSESGQGKATSHTSGGQSGEENNSKKIQENSGSVLLNLDDQLDKFAEELAADVQEVAPDPKARGFEGGVPVDYAPKNTTGFDSKEKLIADLEYRLNKFRYQASETQEEFKKTHDIYGKDHKAYSELVNKHIIQEREIKARHKELAQIFDAEKNSQEKNNLR